MTLVYCCSLNGLIASINLLISMSFWIKASAKRLNVNVQMMSSVCGSNQVRSTKTSVSCLQSSMVVEVSWSGAA